MMQLELDEATARDLQLLAGAWGGIRPEAAIARLIAEFRSKSAPPTASTVGAVRAGEAVNVHVDYAGTRVSATYDLETTAVRVLDGPLAGRLFTKPSTASRAVIGLLNPSQKSKSANGYEFWTVTKTGKSLQSVRRDPPIRRRRR